MVLHKRTVSKDVNDQSHAGSMAIVTMGVNMSDEEPIRCPRCGSTQLTANQKGFGLGKAVGGGLLLGPVGLLGGFLGSKQVKLTCLKCGKQWKPGEGK